MRRTARVTGSTVATPPEVPTQTALSLSETARTSSPGRDAGSEGSWERQVVQVRSVAMRHSPPAVPTQRVPSRAAARAPTLTNGSTSETSSLRDGPKWTARCPSKRDSPKGVPTHKKPSGSWARAVIVTERAAPVTRLGCADGAAASTAVIAMTKLVAGPSGTCGGEGERRQSASRRK